MLGPILDVFTALTVTAGFRISIGVICRSLFMVAAFMYVVFLAKFPGKKVCVGILGAICGYMVLFMAHLYLVGGFSLCLSNIQESAKTFYAPIIAVFLYAVYQEYGQPLTTKSIAIAGSLYTSVILIAYLTGTSFVSYSDSGYGYCGWFFAANEVGCIISISAPITIYYILTMLPVLDKWWKKILTVWTLGSIVFSACFVGTKVVYLFVLTYCLAALIWIVCFKNHYYGWYHLYAHVHTSFEASIMEHDRWLLEELYGKKTQMFNVGVMQPWMGYTPRTLDEIIARSAKYQELLRQFN